MTFSKLDNRILSILKIDKQNVFKYTKRGIMFIRGYFKGTTIEELYQKDKELTITYLNNILESDEASYTTKIETKTIIDELKRIDKETGK